MRVCLCVGAIAIASVVLSVLLLLLLLPVIDSSATRCGLFISFFIAGAATSPPLPPIPPSPPIDCCCLCLKCINQVAFVVVRLLWFFMACASSLTEPYVLVIAILLLLVLLGRILFIFTCFIEFSWPMFSYNGNEF